MSDDREFGERLGKWTEALAKLEAKAKPRK